METFSKSFWTFDTVLQWDFVFVFEVNFCKQFLVDHFMVEIEAKCVLNQNKNTHFRKNYVLCFNLCVLSAEDRKIICEKQYMFKSIPSPSLLDFHIKYKEKQSYLMGLWGIWEAERWYRWVPPYPRGTTPPRYSPRMPSSCHRDRPRDLAGHLAASSSLSGAIEFYSVKIRQLLTYFITKIWLQSFSPRWQ